jgi:hypothetical protein
MIKVGGERGGTIGLISIEEVRKEGAEEMTPTQKRAIHIEFTTDDLEALFEELTARGVTFHEPTHDEPWERVMTAFDPDGYRSRSPRVGQVETVTSGPRTSEPSPPCQLRSSHSAQFSGCLNRSQPSLG